MSINTNITYKNNNMRADIYSVRTRMRVKQNQTITRRNRRIAYFFLLPNIIGFFVFTLIPVGYAMILSFMQWDGSRPMKFTGLSNFIRLLHDSSFILSFINTIVYTVGTVPLIMVFALLLSVLINSGVKGAPLFRAFHFFPHISSIVALSVVWQFLYHPRLGPINQFLHWIGVTNPPAWLSSKYWAMPAVMLMIVWKSVGYYMIIYLAGLKGIPESLYEAAKVDGANKWQQLRYITIPMLKQVNFYVAVMCIIQSFQVFTPIYVMTGGGPGRSTSVLVYQIYKEAFVNFNIGYASTISMVLFICTLCITLFQYRGQYRSRKKRYGNV